MAVNGEYSYCFDDNSLIFPGIVAAQWLMVRLQLIGVAMVTAVAFLAVIEHHFNSVNPGNL